MIQSSPMSVLGGRYPLPPASRRVRPSIPVTLLRSGVSGISTGMAAPPPSGDWASRSRHQYGWPVPFPPPARPEQIQKRWPWFYGEPYGLRALGDAVQAAGSVVGGAATAAGTAAASAGIIASSVVPFIGPAIAGITLGIEAILHSGCGSTCVVTSNWANQAESYLQQNLAAYMALQVPRAQSAQALALQNFDKIWNYLVQQCSNPSVGNAGVRCISDRQAGSCHFHSASGQCWNWFIGYRDPIAQDRNVVPDSQSAAALSQVGMPGPGGTIVANTGTSTNLDSKSVFLVLALGLAAWGLSQGKGAS